MPRSLPTSKSPTSKSPKNTQQKSASNSLLSNRKNTSKQQKWASQIAQLLSRKNRPKAKSAEKRKSKSKTIKYKSLSPNWKPILKEYIPRFRHILSENEIQEILKKKETYDPEIGDKILREIEGQEYNGSLSYSPDNERRRNELSRAHEIKKVKRTKEYMGKSKSELRYDLNIWDCLLKIYGFENIPKSLKDIFDDKDDLFKELRIQEEIKNIMNENLEFKECIHKK